MDTFGFFCFFLSSHKRTDQRSLEQSHISLNLILTNEFHTTVCLHICFFCHFIVMVILFTVTSTSSCKRHLSLILLVAAYENHSRKRPAPVAYTPSASQGCPLMGALTVLQDFKAHQYGIPLTKIWSLYLKRKWNTTSSKIISFLYIAPLG